MLAVQRTAACQPKNAAVAALTDPTRAPRRKVQAGPQQLSAARDHRRHGPSAPARSVSLRFGLVWLGLLVLMVGCQTNKSSSWGLSSLFSREPKLKPYDKAPAGDIPLAQDAGLAHRPIRR